MGDVHETPPNVTRDAPLGVGGDWIVQTIPLHRSMSSPILRVPLSDHPTAKQAFAAGQEAPASVASVAPTGLGVDSTRHAGARAEAIGAHTARPISIAARAETTQPTARRTRNNKPPSSLLGSPILDN